MISTQKMSEGVAMGGVGDSPAEGSHGSDKERLDRLTAICERLWPAIRFWGLCGAAPEFIEAMADLGEFLGKGSISEKSAAVNVAELTRKAKQGVPKEIAEWLRSGSEETRAIGGQKMAERFAEAIEKVEFVE